MTSHSDRAQLEQIKKRKGNKKIVTTKQDESKDDDGEPADACTESQDGPSAGDKAADVAADEDKAGDKGDDDKSPPMTPSLAQRSKIRSNSFRAGSVSGAVSPAPFSPDGDTAPEIYRKHVARIEELEGENKRLAKEAADSERRWKRAEEALSEGDGDGVQGKPGADEETEKRVCAAHTSQSHSLLDQPTDMAYRRAKSPPCSAKTHSSSNKSRAALATAPPCP